jgi:hypothetical protein
MVVIRCECVGTVSPPAIRSRPELCRASSGSITAESWRADLPPPTWRTVVMTSAERLDDAVPGGVFAGTPSLLLFRRVECGHASTASSSSIRTRCCHTRVC